MERWIDGQIELCFYIGSFYDNIIFISLMISVLICFSS